MRFVAMLFRNRQYRQSRFSWPIQHRGGEFASARARQTDAPLSSAPCDQGWPYVPLYTRNPLFAFFSFFAARFSIRLLAGFFFASFFVSIALLITGSSDWREQLAFCDKVSRSGSLENRPIPSKPHAGGAAVRTPAQRGRLLTRAGFQGLWLAPKRFAPGAPRLELGTPCTTYSLVCCLTLLDSSASRLALPLLPVAQSADVHVQQRCELRLAQADF